MNQLSALAMTRPEARHAAGGSLVVSGDRVLNVDEMPQEDWGEMRADVSFWESRVGSVGSYDEAISVVKALAEVAKLLPDEAPVKAVAEAFFDVTEQRDRLLGNLAPLVVEKWLEDGRCDWCPSD